METHLNISKMYGKYFTHTINDKYKYFYLLQYYTNMFVGDWFYISNTIA